MSAAPFLRHARVWPTPASHAMMASGVHDPIARDALDLWFRRAWPFVVRRADDSERKLAETLAVGLALPPSLAKRRLKFHLPYDSVAAHAPPLALDEIVARLPGPFSRALSPLVRAASREPVALRVFGSAAWEAETRLGYLHVDSDVDLLAAPSTRAELASLIALFERAQESVALRLDGEIVFPDGDAVAWREWANTMGAGRVLVKNVSRVALLPRTDLAIRLDRPRLAA